MTLWSSSRSGREIRTAMSGGHTAEPFIDAHPERRREQGPDTRYPLQLLPDVSSRSSRLRVPLESQHGQHVGQGVRHRVFRALSATRPSHHVPNLGNVAQDVFDSRSLDSRKERRSPTGPELPQSPTPDMICYPVQVWGTRGRGMRV